MKKYRTGKECKKTNCKRHENYLAWSLGDSELSICISCKWAFVSQYEPNAKKPTTGRGEEV